MSFPKIGTHFWETCFNVGFVIVGTFKIHPDDHQAFKDILIPHIEETHNRAGALFYTFAQDVRDDSLFHILEGWADRESLEQHNASPEFLDTLKDVSSSVRILGRDANIYTVADQEFVPAPGRHHSVVPDIISRTTL